jgi:hypothetical protein
MDYTTVNGAAAITTARASRMRREPPVGTQPGHQVTQVTERLILGLDQVARSPGCESSRCRRALVLPAPHGAEQISAVIAMYKWSTRGLDTVDPKAASRYR